MIREGGSSLLIGISLEMNLRRGLAEHGRELVTIG
jgi:hypothetical protein